MATAAKIYFPEMTGIRAVAMYGIYNCHFNLIDPAVWGNTLYRLGQEMHLGVPVFYVLSGFLIYYLYGYKLERLSLPWAFDYAKNRVARIYPVYFLLLTFAYLWSGFPGSTRETVITYTLTQALFPDLVHAGIPQTWTLTIEETFYFSAPFIFLAALRWGLLVPCMTIFGLGIFLVTVKFPFNPYYHNMTHVFGRTLFGMIGCFGFGILLGKIVRNRKGDIPRRSRPVFTYVALACMFAIMLVQTRLAEQAEAWHPGGDLVRGSEHPVGYFLSYFVFPGFVMMWFWGMMTESSKVKAFLSIPIIVLLGRSSYCFYLLHFGAVSTILNDFITHSRFGQILLLNILAVLMFKLIEHPANQYIKFLGRPPKSADDLFAGGVDRRAIGYGVLFTLILVVQLAPLSLITQHRADLAYAFLAPGGWLQSLKVAMYVAAGVTFGSALFYGASAASVSTGTRGRNGVLAILAAATLLIAGSELPWGARILEGNSLAAERTVWIVLVTALVGGGALVSAKLPGLKQRATDLGVPLATPRLGIVFGASFVWFLGVDRNVDAFSVAVAMVMFAYSIEVLLESSFEPSSRAFATIMGTVVATAVPLFIVSVATGNPTDSPRVRAAQLSIEAEELSAQGDIAASVEAAEAAVALWPEDSEAQFRLGLGYFQQGNIDAAAESFTLALQLAPNMFDAHNNLGIILLRKNQLEEAFFHFQKAVSLSDHNPDAHNNLGYVLEQLGEFEGAKSEYEIALRLAPTHESARKNLDRLILRVESQR